VKQHLQQEEIQRVCQYRLPIHLSNGMINVATLVEQITESSEPVSEKEKVMFIKNGT
jgi:hypothetical protein